MTPKEKAKDLIKRFYSVGAIECKQCDLIAIDLLIECTPSMYIYPPNFQSKHPRVKEYWQEVKNEIELL